MNLARPRWISFSVAVRRRLCHAHEPHHDLPADAYNQIETILQRLVKEPCNVPVQSPVPTFDAHLNDKATFEDLKKRGLARDRVALTALVVAAEMEKHNVHLTPDEVAACKRRPAPPSADGLRRRRPPSLSGTESFPMPRMPRPFSGLRRPTAAATRSLMRALAGSAPRCDVLFTRTRAKTCCSATATSTK